MNAVDLLEAQHREIEKLFKAVSGADRSSEKARLFQELASKLVGHDAIERQILYPECEETLGMSDELGEALVEHGVIEFALFQADQALGTPEFAYKVKVLKELVEHHVKEEEGEFFPKVRKAIAKDELESLGEELEEAFEDSLEGDYHAPLFDNLRQVLAGVLKPVPRREADLDARN